MQLLIYLLAYPFLWLISILPFPMLYFFSDCICFVVYRVIGYRKKIVRRNLELAFPEKSMAERRDIERKFYHHLCDMFLEMIKTMTISAEEMDRRFTYSNLEVYQKMEQKGKSIAVLCSHYASYEWLLSINKHTEFRGYAIYKQINNDYFDRLVQRIRSRYNAGLIRTRDTRAVIKEHQEKGIAALYGFASDQSPRLSRAQHWANFLGVYSPIHTGAETLAKRFNMNVIFLKVRKIKRGFYQATFEEMTDDVRSLPDYELSVDFIHRVEKQIREQPEYYLWTHKRWKTEGKKPTA
jgi:KDO2-lipid IV(A) lauroyltransferase